MAADPTEARHQALRARLADAAEATIAAEGLPSLKARALAQQAGCAVGAIYQVVDDLDALVIEVNTRTIRALGSAVREAVARHEHAPPAETLAVLAGAYLDYAAANRRRWDALFTHRLPPGRTAPAQFWALQAALFATVEAPLALLCPTVHGPALTLLARTVFSAVHGIVTLGMDQRVAAVDAEGLHAQLRCVVLALARGLA